MCTDSGQNPLRIPCRLRQCRREPIDFVWFCDICGFVNFRMLFFFPVSTKIQWFAPSFSTFFHSNIINADLPFDLSHPFTNFQEHVRNKQRYNKMLKDCLSRVWGCQHGNDESTCANCCSDLRTEGTPIVLAILAKFGRSVSWFILAREDHLQRYISEWDHAGTTYGLLKWKICFTLHLLWSEFCLKDSRVRRKMRLKEEISPSDPIEAWTI